MSYITYRSDLDGLRAIAVLLVLMFHLGLGIPGGYIGVDVFFVLSGFLITGILKREIEQGTFTFTEFYIRRARRILPSLLVVLLMTSIVALVALLPTDLERYAKSVVAALLSVSNYWFWSQGGYFGPDSKMAPLLHTWSLAVEEQFYILLPIALIVSYRLVARFLARTLLFVCACTFFASAWFVSTRTPEVFYFTPFRAWEILLGSLLTYLHLPLVANNLYRQLIAATGLILVVAPAFILTPETVFPGPAAAFSCIGTAILIWIGKSGKSVVGKLLENQLIVFIGLISYSLYLWHWPLLVFVKHVVGEELSISVRVCICLISIALASINWRFIEYPFRSKARVTDLHFFLFLGTAVVLQGAMVAAVLFSKGLSKRFDPHIVALDLARVREHIRLECIDIRVPLNSNTTCRIGANVEPTIFVWGDSYAHAMLPAFDSAFKNLGISAWFAAESGCAPIPETKISFKGRENWRCTQFNEKVVNFVTSQPVLNKIVLTAAWDSYVSKEPRGYELRNGSTKDAALSLKIGIESLAKQLNALGSSREIIVVSQVPNFGWSVPQKMLNSELYGTTIPQLSRDDWDHQSISSKQVFQKLEKSQHIKLVDTSEFMCATGVCRFASENNKPFYWDGGHLNLQGALYIAPMLEIKLSELIISPN